MVGAGLRKNYFEEKFKREKIDAVYENFELNDISEIEDLFLAHPNLCGLNVTIPYKEQIIPYLDEIDEQAQKIGAVNTIYIDKKTGKKKGYNTDVYGLSLIHI